MQITRDTINDTKISLTISADNATLAPIKDATLKRLAGTVKVAGFRPGAAPLSVIEKNLDPQALQSEFLDAAINEMYASAIKKEDLRPINQPNVSLTKFVPFSEIEIKLEIDVIGSVKLPDYKKIKKTRQEVKVTAKDIDEVLNDIAKRSATKKEVTRAAKAGDEVIIDFKGTDTKKQPIKGADGKDYPLLLGSNAFIPGFEDNVIGMKAGAEKTFTLTFPKDYGVKALASKKVTFTVKAVKVNEVALPKLDDAFAAKVGPFKSLEALKEDIKKELTAERERQAQSTLENEVVKAIVDKSTVSLPDTLVTEQIERLKQDVRQNLTYRGQTFQEMLEQEGKTEEEYTEESLKPEAELRVKTGLVLSEISELEKLTVTPEELEIRMQLLKGQYKDESMQVELDKPEARRDIVSRMLTEKTLARILNYVTGKS